LHLTVLSIQLEHAPPPWFGVDAMFANCNHL
jgi:hypothetical protein